MYRTDTNTLRTVKKIHRLCNLTRQVTVVCENRADVPKMPSANLEGPQGPFQWICKVKSIFYNMKTLFPSLCWELHWWCKASTLAKSRQWCQTAARLRWVPLHRSFWVTNLKDAKCPCMPGTVAVINTLYKVFFCVFISFLCIICA